MEKVFALLVLIITTKLTFAQIGYRHLLRLYEDNDYINFLGKITDKGYTNGSSIDFYFNKSHPSVFFIDKWMPNLGPESINTFSYSLTQLMVVPDNLSTTMPDKNDWPYAGALYITHSLHSSNPIKKFSLQTELVVGVLGPLSLAANMQTWIHRVTQYTKPLGWDKQIPGDALLNINFLAEKMLWQGGKYIEIIGGGKLLAGTMIDGASLHMKLRVGGMQPYFEGYNTGYSSARSSIGNRVQFYFFMQPEISFWAYNALLNGGIFNGKGAYYQGNGGDDGSPAIRNVNVAVAGGIVFVTGRAGLSLTQKKFSSVLNHIAGQSVGNISITYSW